VIAQSQQSRDSRCCDRRCSPVRPAHCQKAQSPNLHSPHKCCCGRQGVTARLRKSRILILRQVLPCSSPCALPKSAIRLAYSPHKCCCGRQGVIAQSQQSRDSRCCDRRCSPVRPAHCQKAQSPNLYSPHKCCCGRQGVIAQSQQSRDSRCCDRCCLPVRPAHCQKARNKARLLACVNPVLLILPTMRTKKRNSCLFPSQVLLRATRRDCSVRSNPVNAVVATGVALQFALRTAEKRNPRLAYSPHKCCCGRQGAIAYLRKSRAIARSLPTGVALQFALRTAKKRNPRIFIPLTSVVAGKELGAVCSKNSVTTVTRR
jgi:hypothetical protein